MDRMWKQKAIKSKWLQQMIDIASFGVTLNLFAIKSPWTKYASINMPSRNMLAEKCPAEKTPLP